jgi:hypothetical protein
MQQKQLESYLLLAHFYAPSCSNSSFESQNIDCPSRRRVITLRSFVCSLSRSLFLVLVNVFVQS